MGLLTAVPRVQQMNCYMNIKHEFNVFSYHQLIELPITAIWLISCTISNNVIYVSGQQMHVKNACYNEIDRFKQNKSMPICV